MNSKFVLLVIALLCAATTKAQRHTVFLGCIGESTASNFQSAVVSALEARIGATTRYKLSSDANAELVMHVACIDMTQVARGITGGVCSYTLRYSPPGLYGISDSLIDLVAVSNNSPSEIAESAFEDFVKSSSDKKLAFSSDMMHASISLSTTQ